MRNPKTAITFLTLCTWLAASVLTGCAGREPLPTYTPYPAPRVTLHIVDDFFQESDIVVVKGTVVTWLNQGESPHSATAALGSRISWDTGLLKTGERGTKTFSEAGIFAYVCSVHDYMNATIRVID